MTREPIYVALFTKLQAIGAGFATYSRHLRHWTDVQATEQPSLFQVQVGELAQPQPLGLPTKWTLSVDLYVYVKGDGKTAMGATINPLLDAITTAIAPDNPSGKQTLGGLVEHCWIEGALETDEGVLGDQSVVIIPIRILAT